MDKLFLFQFLDTVPKRLAVNFVIQWRTTWPIIILSECKAILGFTKTSWDSTFKHLVVALVLVTEAGIVVMEVAICSISISRICTAQVAAKQTFPYTTGTTSWRLLRPYLSQLLASNLKPPVKRSTETETLWREKRHTTIIRILTKVSGLKLVVHRNRKKTQTKPQHSRAQFDNRMWRYTRNRNHSEGVVSHWNRIPREVVTVPSLSEYECLDSAVSNII